MKGNEQAVDADVVQPDQKVRQVNPILVDHPTQLICIWIFICQQTNTTDIAGQSVNPILAFWWKYDRYCILCICNMTSFSGAEWDDSTLRPRWKKKHKFKRSLQEKCLTKKLLCKEKFKRSLLEKCLTKKLLFKRKVKVFRHCHKMFFSQWICFWHHRDMYSWIL